MRVISGWARGKKLESIKSPDVRPTTDRVKEAVFNIIQFELSGCTFLDLFGGTGQMGLEALSRGAKKVVIVDNNRESLKVIRNNVSDFKNNLGLSVIDNDASAFLKNTNLKFDVAFLDPPYESKVLRQVFPYIDRVINPNGIVITETSLNGQIPEETQRFILKKSYKYGNIIISVYMDKNV